MAGFCMNIQFWHTSNCRGTEKAMDKSLEVLVNKFSVYIKIVRS